MKLTQSVQLAEDVHQRVKARALAEDRSVRDIVVSALQAYLGETHCPVCNRPWPTEGVEIAAKKIAESAPAIATPKPGHTGGIRTLDVQATTGGKATVETAAPVVVPNTTCRRCAHAKARHFPKGCVAKCLCNEARYLAP